MRSEIEYEYNKRFDMVMSMKYTLDDYDDSIGSIKIESSVIIGDKGIHYDNHAVVFDKENEKEFRCNFGTRNIMILPQYINMIKNLMHADKGISLDAVTYNWENSNNKTDDTFYVKLTTDSGDDIVIDCPRENFITKVGPIAVKYDSYSKKGKNDVIAKYIIAKDTITIYDYEKHMIDIVKSNSKDKVFKELILSEIKSNDKFIFKDIPNLNIRCNRINLDGDMNIVNVKYDNYGIIARIYTGTGELNHQIMYSDKNSQVIKSVHEFFYDPFDPSLLPEEDLIQQDIITQEGDIYTFTRNIHNYK